jgi:hypothetical protein
MRQGWVLLGALCLAGCSTITKGSTQAVVINTPGVEKAECVLKSEGIGSKTVITPASVILDKSQHDIEVSCRKKCYLEGKGTIASHTDEMTAGNLIFGGAVGLVVDASSGAMNQYEPQVQVTMQRAPNCKG